MKCNTKPGCFLFLVWCLPPLRPHAASNSVLPTCLPFLVCTGAQLDSSNSSLVSARNGRHSLRTVPRSTNQVKPLTKLRRGSATTCGCPISCSFVVMSCQVMSCHVITSCHVMSCHVMSCHECHVMSVMA